jgi:polysaccharide export outer membrane protein
MTGNFFKSLRQLTQLLATPLATLALLATSMVAGVANGAESTTSIAEYRLHAGDKLDVAVWKEVELTRPALVISPDGRISFPLVGDVMAGGRTVTEVRGEIENRLKKYIPEPVVTVLVAGVEGNVSYVIGQVNKPGAIVMNPAINVMQALSIAGGATPFAKLDSIIVIRRAAAGQKILNFRYGQVADGKNLEQNVQLEAGDVVVVP